MILKEIIYLYLNLRLRVKWWKLKKNKFFLDDVEFLFLVGVGSLLILLIFLLCLINFELFYR